MGSGSSKHSAQHGAPPICLTPEGPSSSASLGTSTGMGTPIIQVKANGMDATPESTYGAEAVHPSDILPALQNCVCVIDSKSNSSQSWLQRSNSSLATNDAAARRFSSSSSSAASAHKGADADSNPDNGETDRYLCHITFKEAEEVICVHCLRERGSLVVWTCEKSWSDLIRDMRTVGLDGKTVASWTNFIGAIQLAFQYRRISIVQVDGPGTRKPSKKGAKDSTPKELQSILQLSLNLAIFCGGKLLAAEEGSLARPVNSEESAKGLTAHMISQGSSGIPGVANANRGRRQSAFFQSNMVTWTLSPIPLISSLSLSGLSTPPSDPYSQLQDLSPTGTAGIALYPSKSPKRSNGSSRAARQHRRGMCGAKNSGGESGVSQPLPVRTDRKKQPLCEDPAYLREVLFAAVDGIASGQITMSGASPSGTHSQGTRGFPGSPRRLTDTPFPAAGSSTAVVSPILPNPTTYNDEEQEDHLQGDGGGRSPTTKVRSAPEMAHMLRSPGKESPKTPTNELAVPVDGRLAQLPAAGQHPSAEDVNAWKRTELGEGSRARRPVLLLYQQMKQKLTSMVVNGVDKRKQERIRRAMSHASDAAFELLSTASRSWGFDALRLCEVTGGKPLSMLGEYVFHYFDFCDKYDINIETMRRFLLTAEESYPTNPFHNRAHATDVLQAYFCLLVNPEFNMGVYLDDLDKFAAVVACIGHDVSHPGVTNAYQIRVESELAQTYNDVSVLENYHCAQLFRILRQPECNITMALSTVDFRHFRDSVVSMILATDMSLHFDFLKRFEREVSQKGAPDQKLLSQVMMKCADVSNPTRPLPIYKEWVERLMTEFWNQGDLERKREDGLGISPFMDKERPNVPRCQLTFMTVLVKPLFEAFGRLCRGVNSLVETVDSNKKYWEMECEKLREQNGESPIPPKTDS